MATPNLQHELGKRKPFDVPEQEAFLNTIRTASLLSAAFQRLFRTHKLSESTYNALRILRGSTGPGRGGSGGDDRDECVAARTCSQIGEHLVARVPDVTRLIDRLEQLGFAERVRCDKDRRVVHVKITRKGLDLLAKLDEPVLALHRAQMGHLTRAELAELSRLLVKARHGDANSVAVLNGAAPPRRGRRNQV